MVNHLHVEVFWCERVNTAKQRDGLTSFFTLSVLEAKIFQYACLEEHKMCENNPYWSSTKRNEVVIMATKPEFLASKKDINFSCIGNRISRNFEPWGGY